MSVSAVNMARPTRIFARAACFVEVCKPRIAVLALLTVAVAAVMASRGQPQMLLLFNALLGSFLVAASSSAANQWIERRRDALMHRTSERPLPSGRLHEREVMAFTVITLLLGELVLALFVNPTTAGLGLLTWLLYVCAYTPLKTRTSWNTFVGAIAGAMPWAMGWAATGATLDMRAWVIWTLLFLWQFPHFMAIAWIYRKQYAAAGHQMLTVVDPTGRRAGLQAVAAALGVLVVGLVPTLLAPETATFGLSVFVLALLQLGCAARFCLRRDEASARWLLRASLVYLPSVLALLLLHVPLI